MWVPKTNVLTVNLRMALLPISLGVITLVYFRWRPNLLILGLLCAVLPVYLILEARYVASRRRTFERDFNLNLQRGDIGGLNSTLRRLGLFRWVAPPGFLEEKRGLVATLRKDWEKAEEHLERAYLKTASESQRNALLPAILRVKYEIGSWEEAEQIGSQVVGQTPFATSSHLFLGLIKVRRPADRQEGIDLLNAAVEGLAGDDQARARAALNEMSEKTSG